MSIIIINIIIVRGWSDL